MRYPLIVACAAVLGVLSPALARAQGAPQPPASGATGNRERARELANRGFELFEAGQYAEALQALQAAEAEFHAPTILLHLARTQVRLGRLVEAKASYERIIGEALPPGAPPAFLEAQSAARAELAEVVKRAPTVEILVHGPGAEGARVAVDGVDAAAGQRLLQNPGHHTISVRAQGAAEVLREVTLAEGAAERVEIDLAPASGGASPSADAAPRRGSILPAAVAFGVSGVALGIGAVTGLMTFSRVSDLEKDCPDQRCPPTLEDELGSARTLGTVSDVSFVVAGLAATTGVVLLLMRPEEPRSPQVGMVVKPSWVGLHGTF